MNNPDGRPLDRFVEWLKRLPKTAFVTLVLAAGVIFIVLLDPPRTVCDTQISAFKEKTADFLALDKIKKPNVSETRYTKLVDTCKTTNTPGGCFELFLSLKQLLKEAGTVSAECFVPLASYTPLSEAIWGGVDLMARLAWGTKPPAYTTLRVGWFDASDLNLFCQLKMSANNLYGDKKWNAFVEMYFNLLPGVPTLERSEAWQRMLFATNCSGYL